MSKRKVVELRVHGVSGTPPEQLLDCPAVDRVTGDDMAGFYTPHSREDQMSGGGSGASASGPPRRLEAYAWGGLTSRGSSRAFWLLLLPFTLINIAPRLRPPITTFSVSILWYLTRLIALSMTILIVASVAGVGVDLVGWQCSSGANCSAASPAQIMRPVLSMSKEHRMAIGAILPIVVTLVFWRLSVWTTGTYEDIEPDVGAVSYLERSEGIDSTLDSRWMWNNGAALRRLRHIHLQASFVIVIWLVSYPFREAWRLPCVCLAAVVTTYHIVALGTRPYVGRGPSESIKRINAVVWLLILTCGGTTMAALIWDHPLEPKTTGRGLPGYAGSTETIFVTQAILLLALGCVVLYLAHLRKAIPSEDIRSPIFGIGAIILAILAVFLGIAFSSGVYAYAAGSLVTGSVKPAFDQVSRATGTVFKIPVVVADALRSYAVVVGIVGLALAAGILFVSIWRLARVAGIRRWPSGRYGAWLASAYPQWFPKRGDMTAREQSDADRVAQSNSNMFWLGYHIDRVHRYITALVCIVLVVMLSFSALTVLESLNLWTGQNCLLRWRRYLGSKYVASHPSEELPVTPCGPRRGFVHWLNDGILSSQSLQGAGAYLVVITLVLLVAFGAASFRSAERRRWVGTLWDVASFWPRVAHPFAAPCYAERAVPDIVSRIYWHVNSDGASVVVVANDQGTVIAAAALIQLAAIDRAQGRVFYTERHVTTQLDESPTLYSVALLTFNCILGRHYAKYFPAYFGLPELAVFRDAVLTDGDGSGTRWRNMWHDADYVGGPIWPDGYSDATGPDIDVRLAPSQPGREGGDTVWQIRRTYSEYFSDPMFVVAMGTLATDVEGNPGGHEPEVSPGSC